jgi:hypothetical protein
MRCRNHRRAELHYSQLDDLDDHLSKANTAQSLATAIIKGITGWYRNPNYQIPIPRYNCIRTDRVSPNTVLRKALTDQTLSAGDACTPAKSPRTSKQFIMLTVPRAATTATPMLPLSPTLPASSSLYSSTKSKINGNFEMKHSTAATAPKFHSSIASYSRPKLLDSTPTLEIYVRSTAPSSLTHTHYLRPIQYQSRGLDLPN